MVKAAQAPAHSQASTSEPSVAGSFDRVFADLAPFVLRVLLRLGIAARDVDDVAQEVFVAVHRGLAQFEGRSSLKTWVYGICIRVSQNHRRRAHHRHEQATATPPEQLDARTPANELASRRALAALDAALAQLPDAQRNVYVLHEIEALSVREIALALGSSKFTVYARLYKARQVVLTLLGAHAKEWREHD